MKKALLCGLSAALLLALVLVACNKPQADQPDPPPTPSAVQTQPPETPEPEETSEPVNQVEKMSVNTQQETDTRRLATEEELLKMFQLSYEFGQIFANTGYSDEDVLEEELFRLNGFIESPDDFRVPDDVEVQYIKWRVLNHGTATPVSAEEQQQTTSTAGTTTTTTTTMTQTVATASTGDDGTTQQGSLVQQPSSGDLGIDVTGGMSPNDFHNAGRDEERQQYIDEHSYLDMSKVGSTEKVKRGAKD